MSSLAKHVIHQPKPYRCLIIVIISIVIATVSIWLYLQETSANLSEELRSLQQSHQALQLDKQQLKQSHQRLNQELAIQQQFSAIQQATDQQLQLQLSQLQDQVVRLNKELMFYQKITQGASSSKLQIRELHLRADQIQTDIVHYRIVITQGEKISKPISGVVTLTLNSSNGGKSIPVGEHSLSLRHVQILEGQIKLADNIEPDTVTVALKRSKRATLSKKFDWKIAD